MAEKSTKHTPVEDRIPPEVRQHVRAAREELRQGLQAFLPPEFIAHGRKARKEMLLAWRSVIDSALQRIEEQDKESA